VYQKVDTKDDAIAIPEEYELEELGADKKEDKASADEKPKQVQQPNRVRACAKCCTMSCCVLLLAVVFVFSIVAGVVAYRVKHCVNPEITSIHTFSYEPANIDTLSFDIPAGSISVHTCHRATNVSVKVITGAKSQALLKQFKVNIQEPQKALSVVVRSPSFDMLNCHIVHVEVVIPASSSHPISLSASAGLGSIRINTDSYTFDKVDLNVELGRIKMRHVDAKEVTARTYLGAISGKHVKTEGLFSVHTEVGGACLYHVDASKSVIEVQKGILRVHNLDATSVSAKVNYGYATLQNVFASYLESEMNFGKLWITPSKEFAGEIVFNSTTGNIDISTAVDVTPPAIVVVSPEVQTLQVVDKAGNLGIGKMLLKSNSANADLNLVRCK